VTIYVGNRIDGYGHVVVDNGRLKWALDPATHLVNLSDGALSWGDSSKASQQLAVALCWELLKTRRLVAATAPCFLWAWVVHQREYGFNLREEELHLWITRIRSSFG
jgi:hypothetical protein